MSYKSCKTLPPKNTNNDPVKITEMKTNNSVSRR